MSVRAVDPQRSRIVLLGTPAYHDEDLPDVPQVSANLADLAAVFTDPDVGGFPAENCVTAPAGASVHEIGDLLHQAAEQAEDLLLFYYAGHGVLGRGGELYLSLHHTRLLRPEYSALRFETVRGTFLDSPAANRAVIVDCCYSGRAIGPTLGADQQAALGQLEISGTYTLASAPPNSLALVRPDERHTAFTGRLLNLLHEGSEEAGDPLSLGEIYRHLHARLRADGLPVPQQRGTATADLLGLVRNQHPASTSPTPDSDAHTPPGQIPEPTPPSPDPDPPAKPEAPQPPTARRPITQFALTPATTRNHTAVADLVFSPDGRLLAAIDAENTVQLWHTDTGRPYHRPLAGYRGNIASLVFNPVGGTLAAAGYDEVVRVWDLASGQQIGGPIAGRTPVFSPDGRLLATAHGADVRLWTAADARSTGDALTGHTDLVYAAVFNPDGTLLATASRDTTVRLWNPANGKPVTEPLEGHAAGVNAAAFSPDGRLLATASADRSVRLWDRDNGWQPRSTLEGHTGFVDSVAFSPDGSLLASGSSDGTVRLWNSRTGQPEGTALRGTGGPVNTVEWTADGRMIIGRQSIRGVGGTARSVVGLWDPATGRPYTIPLSGLPRVVAVNPDGRRLAAGDDDMVRIWSPSVQATQQAAQSKTFRLTVRQRFLAVVYGLLLAAGCIAWLATPATRHMAVLWNVCASFGIWISAYLECLAASALTMTPLGVEIRKWWNVSIPWNNITAIRLETRSLSEIKFMLSRGSKVSWAPRDADWLRDSAFDDKFLEVQQWSEHFGGPVLW